MQFIKEFNEYLNDNFKKWFGNSKVLSEYGGEPLVVYHGSPYGSITSFDNKNGKNISSGLKEEGFMFTDNIHLAEHYRKGRKLKPEYIVNVKMVIKKLEDIRDEIRNNKEYNEIQDRIDLLYRKLRGDIYQVFLKMENPFIFDAKGKDGYYGWQECEINVGYKWAKGIDAIEAIKGNNSMYKSPYDGIIAKNMIDLHLHDKIPTSDQRQMRGNVYLVFKPNQIKSATNNNGNFNPNSDNINEFRNQLEIPFDGKHPMHDKPTHIHVLDALTEMDRDNGVKVEDYWSDWSGRDITDAWDNNQTEAFKFYKEHILDTDDIDINYIYLNRYNPFESPEYFTDEVALYIEENELENTRKCLIDMIEHFDLYYELYSYISDKGIHILENDIVYDLYYDKQDEHDCEYTLRNELNDDGLVPLYRAINYGNSDDKDAYENIMNFNSVGIYWSFEHGGAIPHGGGGGGETMIISALVKPEYINWEQTIFKSAWHLNDEKEVELLEDGNIMIIAIENEKGVHLKLPKKLIVKI